VVIAQKSRTCAPEAALAVTAAILAAAHCAGARRRSGSVTKPRSTLCPASTAASSIPPVTSKAVREPGGMHPQRRDIRPK
jgi:hypothetical protein